MVDMVLTVGVASIFVVPIFADYAFVVKRGGGRRWRGYPAFWVRAFQATTGVACAAWVLFILSVHPGCGTQCFFLGLPALAATTPLALMAYLALLLHGRDLHRREIKDRPRFQHSEPPS